VVSLLGLGGSQCRRIQKSIINFGFLKIYCLNPERQVYIHGKVEEKTKFDLNDAQRLLIENKGKQN